MRRKTTFTVALSVAAFAVILGAQPGHALTCSATKIAGRWGFTTNGVLLTAQGSVPVSSVGVFTVDNAGNFTGQQTRNIGGQIAEETINGSGTINADCSGSLNVNVLEGGVLVRTTTLAAQWDDNLNEENAMFTSVVLKPSETRIGSVVALHARRLVPRD